MPIAKAGGASCRISGIQVIEVLFAPLTPLSGSAPLADTAAGEAVPRAASQVTCTLQALPTPLAPGLREGLEARLALVTFLAHHSRFAAALAITVALWAEGTVRVAAAGQAAVLLPLAEEALLAALTAGTLRVAQAAKAAVPIACLPQEVPVEDALPGHPVAVAH